MWIRQQFFGKYYDLFCVVGINYCIVEGVVVGFIGVVVGIIEFIIGWDVEESYVDIQFVVLYQMYMIVVRVDLYWFCQQIMGDFFRQWIMQVGGINVGNYVLVNVFYQWCMVIIQGVGCQGQVFKVYFCDDVYYYIDGQVIVMESVMEGNCYVVL